MSATKLSRTILSFFLHVFAGVAIAVSFCAYLLGFAVNPGTNVWVLNEFFVRIGMALGVVSFSIWHLFKRMKGNRNSGS